MTEITAKLSTALADRYKIERHLGEGGMATVYLAEDLKHKRKVAVKVLRPELAAVLGAERFVQEITTTANLQHPHILPLFDSGEADSFLYYVMPFIDGETLRDKLNRETQLGIEEAVGITTAIADALDYAHRNNVIHRDIKPENILLHDGRPMVADFGIALALSAAAGGRMTETGMSLGTPHYMSPEQATAEKDLTNRSDIYSLGAVLYEMLTGEPPHMGNSAQAIIMKIVTDEARPVTELRKSVPPHVAAATGKALEKLAADRFATAKEFAEALTNPAFTLPTTQAAALAGAAASGPWNRLSIATTALATLFLIGAVWGLLRPEPQQVTRQRIVLWDRDVQTNAVRYTTAIAPDGSGIVYSDLVGDNVQLVYKARDQADVTPLAGTEGGAGPFFSPDGSWIGFIAEGNLRKVPVGGGASLTLADSVQGGNWTSGAWLEDGTIFYVATGFNLKRVGDAGGEAEVVVRGADIERFVVDVSPLPDARGVLFSACTANCTESEVYVYDAAADTVRMLFEEAQGVWYVPTGHVLYASRRGGVFAAPFDLADLAVTGGAVPALEGVLAPNLAVSPGGAVLYRIGKPNFASNMAEAVWVDRSGGATIIDPNWVFDAGGSNRGWTLSPDDTHLALRMRTDAGFDIWVKELPRGPLSRLTFYEGDDRKAQWSPDGESVRFISDRGGDYDVWVRRADGTGEAELVVDNDGFIAFATGTSDGKLLVLRTGGAAGVEGARDILVFRPGVDSLPTPLLRSTFDEWAPALSPDDRWLAYASTETGQQEIFVRPFPDVDAGKWQISTAGGINPMWSHTGTELFYVSSSREMIVAQVETRTAFRVGVRRALFRIGDEYIMGEGASYYDVAADDQRFLMVRQAGVDDEEEPEEPSYILVYNWFEELRRRMRN